MQVFKITAIAVTLIASSSVSFTAISADDSTNKELKEKAKVSFFKSAKQATERANDFETQQKQANELRDQAMDAFVNAGRHKDFIDEQASNLDYYVQLEVNKAVETEVSYKKNQIKRLNQLVSSNDCIDQANGCPTLLREQRRLEQQVKELNSKIKTALKKEK
jgi:hypothetical protein